MLEIGYRIFAPGSLFLYTKTLTLTESSRYGSTTQRTTRTVEGQYYGRYTLEQVTVVRHQNQRRPLVA